MLKEISKKDKEWRLIALKICGDKQLADDLVQDMYLKVHRLNPDKANRHYISYTIYHLFIDHLRKSKDNLKNIDDYINRIEADENEILKSRQMINDALSELSLWDREILLNTHEQSLRANEAELGITVNKLFYSKQKALNNLKQTQTIRDYGKT